MGAGRTYRTAGAAAESLPPHVTLPPAAWLRVLALQPRHHAHFSMSNTPTFPPLQTAGAALPDGDAPCSPLNGKPLSPRAAEFAKLEGDLLEEGPRLL